MAKTVRNAIGETLQGKTGQFNILLDVIIAASGVIATFIVSKDTGSLLVFLGVLLLLWAVLNLVAWRHITKVQRRGSVAVALLLVALLPLGVWRFSTQKKAEQLAVNRPLCMALSALSESATGAKNSAQAAKMKAGAPDEAIAAIRADLTAVTKAAAETGDPIARQQAVTLRTSWEAMMYTRFGSSEQYELWGRAKNEFLALVSSKCAKGDVRVSLEPFTGDESVEHVTPLKICEELNSLHKYLLEGRGGEIKTKAEWDFFDGNFSQHLAPLLRHAAADYEKSPYKEIFDYADTWTDVVPDESLPQSETIVILNTNALLANMACEEAGATGMVAIFF